MENFGNRLASLMREAKVTQEQVASLLGIRQANLSEWKHTDKVPRADIVFRLADFLGVSARYLALGEDNTVAQNDDKERNPQLNPADAQLLDKWHKLTDVQKSAVQMIVDVILAK